MFNKIVECFRSKHIAVSKLNFRGIVIIVVFILQNAFYFIPLLCIALICTFSTGMLLCRESSAKLKPRAEPKIERGEMLKMAW